MGLRKVPSIASSDRDYADLEDKDQAFKWLNSAYQERGAFMLGLKTDFLLDPLHSDPRFDERVRKVGLPI